MKDFTVEIFTQVGQSVRNRRETFTETLEVNAAECNSTGTFTEALEVNAADEKL
jgi:hypothetical protein